MRKAINFKGKQGFLFGCKQQSRELLRDMSGFRTASEKVPTMKSQGAANVNHFFTLLGKMFFTP